MKTMKAVLVGITAVMVTVLAPRAAHADGDVQVHVESNKADVTLERVTGQATATASGPGGMATASATSYAMACAVPCDKPLDRNAKYVFRGVSGPGGSSAEFILPARDSVKLDVKSGSPGTWTLGFTGVVLGIIAGVGGGAFVLVGATSDKGSWTAAGGAVGGVGVVMLIGGLVLMATNGTSVTTEKNEVLADAKPAPSALHPRIGVTSNGFGGVF